MNLFKPRLSRRMARQLAKNLILRLDIETLIELTHKQIDAFKILIIEEYGWPSFTLNFSKDMKHIIKIKL